MARPIDDLSGSVFGYINVISFNRTTLDSGRVRHETYWNCFCTRCKKEFEMRARVLKRKGTFSCGCYGKERSIKDFTGKRFGLLYVISRVGTNKNSKSVFLCKCDCGNYLEVIGANLARGLSMSCGCKSESSIARELKLYFKKRHSALIEYKELKSSKTGRWLPYDIYIPKGRVYIEIQGIQHYRQDNYFSVKMAERNKTSLKEEFNKIEYVDKLKKLHAESLGIYVAVDLRIIKTLGDAIQYINSFLTISK
jgi:hypothetical protein